MAKQKFWNGTAWEVVGTDAAKVAVVDSANKLAATNVEDALLELFTFASDGKTAVANAVTAKGVTASPTDTFPTLATKIGQISTGTNTTDATAVAGDILSGKTAYANGNKLTGTMVAGKKFANGTTGTVSLSNMQTYDFGTTSLSFQPRTIAYHIYKNGVRTLSGSIIDGLFSDGRNINNNVYSMSRTITSTGFTVKVRNEETATSNFYVIWEAID